MCIHQLSDRLHRQDHTFSHHLVLKLQLPPAECHEQGSALLSLLSCAKVQAAADRDAALEYSYKFGGVCQDADVLQGVGAEQHQVCIQAGSERQLLWSADRRQQYH